MHYFEIRVARHNACGFAGYREFENDVVFPVSTIANGQGRYKHRCIFYDFVQNGLSLRFGQIFIQFFTVDHIHVLSEQRLAERDIADLKYFIKHLRTYGTFNQLGADEYIGVDDDERFTHP